MVDRRRTTQAFLAGFALTVLMISIKTWEEVTNNLEVGTRSEVLWSLAGSMPFFMAVSIAYGLAFAALYAIASFSLSLVRSMFE